MADPGSKSEGALKAGWRRRSNLLALLLMALATLGSAWSGYQSSLWNGTQTFLLSDASHFSRESNEKAMIASQQRAVDAALFVQFAREYYYGKRELADFLLQRAHPELRDALKAWMATRPASNPDAPATPFLMPQYRLPAEADSQEMLAKSSAAHDQAQQASRNSDSYSLLGVLFTSALFLAGLVSGFDERRARSAILVLSFATLLAAAIFLLGLPIAHRG